MIWCVRSMSRNAAVHLGCLSPAKPPLTQRDLLESSDLHVIIVPIGHSSRQAATGAPVPPTGWRQLYVKGNYQPRTQQEAAAAAAAGTDKQPLLLMQLNNDNRANLYQRGTSYCC